MLHVMTLHRARRPYSLAYARRQLARIDAGIAYWTGVNPGSDWRLAADKRQALTKLDAERWRWQAVVEPRPAEKFRMPF